MYHSVCYLRLEGLKPGAGDAQQSEMGIRGLPGQPGTGTKPSYLPARVVLPIRQLLCQLVLFLPHLETVLLCLPLSMSTPCVLCPGQGDFPAHLSPREAEGPFGPRYPSYAESRIAAAIWWESSLAAGLCRSSVCIRLCLLKKVTSSQASFLANAVCQG